MENEEMVTITKGEYEWLLKDRKKLLMLERGGVDNWEGYSYAMTGDEEEEE